jgi:hypothetical protein
MSSMTPTLLVLVWGGLEVEMGNQIGDRIELSNFYHAGVRDSKCA